MTYIAQIRVNAAPHFCDPPFDNIAEVLIVNVVILFQDRPLRALFEFILTVTE
jgi:hypothetical protein